MEGYAQKVGPGTQTSADFANQLNVFEIIGKVRKLEAGVKYPEDEGCQASGKSKTPKPGCLAPAVRSHF